MVPAPTPVVAAARAIAGWPVQVRCGRLTDGGEFATMVILLDQTVCTELRRYLHGTVDADTAWGVLALTHEAVHAAGLISETDTECEASRLVRFTARHLGRPATPKLLRLAARAHTWVRTHSAYGIGPCHPPTR